MNAAVSRPGVDVIVPCYNYGRFLRACVGSVLDQADTPVRVLIIDDASPDGSAQVARQLAAEDPRVEVREHLFNRGHIATYNEGIAWARAEYLLVLSADDMSAPGALARAMALMEAHPEVGFVYGRARHFRGDGTWDTPPETTRTIPGLEFVRRCCETVVNPVETATAVVRTELQKRLGGYLPSLPHAGDLEMWMRFAAHADVGVIDAVQGQVRLHDVNMRHGYQLADDARQRHEAVRHVLRRHLTDRSLARRLEAAAARRLSEELLDEAARAFDNGRPYDEALRQALSLRPAAALRWPYAKLAIKRRLRALSPATTKAPALGLQPRAEDADGPEVSLILSTRNRGRFLQPCLDALAAIQSRRRWELVVVDNGSTDETRPILEAFARAAAMPVQLVSEPTPGLSFARNTGVRAARGRLLAFTDDDCYPRPDFIDALSEVFARHDVGFIGGQILLHDPDDAPVSITTRTDTVIFPPGSFIGTGEIQGACMAFRREVFEHVGLFDTAFGAGGPLIGAEDCEMVARACFAGWRGGFFPEVVIRHHHRRKADGAARITWSYDVSRGAFFAKLLLRQRGFRRQVLKAWYWDSHLARPHWRRAATKLWREIAGAWRYTTGFAFAATTPRS